MLMVVLATILAIVPDKARPGVLKAFQSMGSGASQPKVFLSGVSGLSKQLLDDLEQCTMSGGLSGNAAG